MKTIYKNGAVYTGKLPLVEAFAVEDGKFVFAGSSAEADALAAAGDKVVDLGGKFVCSTYGSRHMQEVSQLVQDFDSRIVLSADKLYERFGRENGRQILSPYFTHISWKNYEDSLLVPDAEPLISYILSCHGNQNQYLLDRYKDFRSFVSRKTRDGFFITKDAGIFFCEK